MTGGVHKGRPNALQRAPTKIYSSRTISTFSRVM